MESIDFLHIIKHIIYNVEHNYGWGEELDELSSMIKEVEDNNYDSLVGNNSHQPIPVVIISKENCLDIIRKENPKESSLANSDISAEIDFNQINNIMDILGQYVYEKPKKEGKIILYSQCIERYANFSFRYFKEQKQSITKEDCVRLLYDIVVWHELGHWITHWMLDKSGSRWNSESFVKASRDIKEGLAQLFTFYAIRITDHDKHNYSLLFEFMQKHQESCYLKHIVILNHKKFTWENVMISIQEIREKNGNKGLELKSFLESLDKN